MAIPMVAPPNTYGLGGQPNLFTSAAARPMPPRADERYLPRQGVSPFDPAGNARANATTTPGTGNQGGMHLTEDLLAQIRNSSNPLAAIAAYRLAMGQQGRDKGLWGADREQMMGSALRALLTMIMPDGGAGGGPVEQANALLGQFAGALQGGQGVGGLLRQTAAGIRPEDLSGYDSQQILDILGAQQAAGGFGYGRFAQMGLDNAYSDLEDRAARNEFDPLRDPANSPLAQPGALDNFTALLQRYLGTK